MEVTDISRLASYLRDNGDQILNCATKLVLTAPLLLKLNQSFPLIVENDNHNGSSSTQFQVINTNNSKFEIFHDLAFLHDFIQKTINLKLINVNAWTTGHRKDVLDIGKFSLLQGLELRGVPVGMVSGIQCVRHQLTTLVCHRCLGSLEEVLKHCGSDRSTGLVWNELHKAVFSHNTLDTLDHSIDYIPFVQDLDLSHNRLTNVDPIIFLPNLKCLKLSYNLLQSVPTFSKSASQKLHLLVLNCNHLEDISGLSSLESLQYLDLSCNCLIEHSGALWPLLRLQSLTWLSLDGNPLSFHKQHRVLTARCLPHSAGNQKFLLDLVPLSKSERLVVGTASPVVDSSHVTTATSVTSSVVSAPQSQRRSGKVREAFIADDNQDIEQELSASVISTSFESSGEHLATKKQIEILRERFGQEDWLHSRGGSYVQDLLGLPSMPAALAPAAEEDGRASASTEREERRAPVSTEDQERRASVSTLEPASSEAGEMESEESSFAEDDIEGRVYSVLTDAGDDLFVELSATTLRERDASRGQVTAAWARDDVTSCTRLFERPPVTVQLTFDTVLLARQLRRYTMEPQDAQELLSVLRAQLEERALAAGLHVYRCLQCSSEFSLERADCCPVCSGGLIVETEEHSPTHSFTGSETIGRSESDEIEVISNPSQSSIEVLDPAPILAAITESSSSGSLPDSVCTSYEQPLSNRERVVVDTSTGSPVQYNYEDYSQVDHRLQLHLYLRVFTEDQEQLAMLVRARVAGCAADCVAACVVISTHRIYVLQVTAREADDPECWLKQLAAVKLAHLQLVYALAWDLGVGLRFDSALELLLLMRESRVTRQLITFLSGMSLPGQLVSKCAAAPPVIQLLSCSDMCRTHASLLTSASVRGQTLGGLSALIVTDTALVIAHGSLLWLSAGSDVRVQAAATQKMTNLIEVEPTRESLALHFLDETIAESDETWLVWMDSEAEIKDVLFAIQEPWEQLFGIALQVTRKP